MTEPVAIRSRVLCSGLEPEAELDGAWLSAKECAARGVELAEARGMRGDGVTLELQLRNRGGDSFRCGGLRWRRNGIYSDFAGAPGEELRIYLEGWSMPSACGSRRYGDVDFASDPDYVRFAVCHPETHCSDRPNVFRAEHVIVVNHCSRKESMLIGFLTSGRQFGRFELRLGPGGLEELAITCDCDGMEFAPGEMVRSETLYFNIGADGYLLLEQFAELWADAMHVRPFRPLPTGWCSWYSCFDRVTERDVLESVAHLEAHRVQYPLEYIQLDDGYQSALGDWLAWNGKFPNGPRFLASEIRKAGFKPALWLAPFLAGEDSALFKAHPDWMVRSEEGDVDLSFGWRENLRVAILDGTHPGVQRYFTELFREVRRIGFEYVKLDFLVQGVTRGVRYDRRSTRCEALRRGMEAIREGFGDGFILGCTAPLGAVAGVVDGERIAPDITPYWAPDGRCYDEAPTLPNVCRNAVNRCYLHRRLWLNDPDAHIAREGDNKLTENEVLLWTSALRMLGGMLFSGDRAGSLSPGRAGLLRDLLASPDEFSCRPLDFFERSAPSAWLATSRRDGGRMLGLFNFEDCEREFRIAAAQLGRETLELTELPAGIRHGDIGAEWRTTIAAHSCRLFRVQ